MQKAAGQGGGYLLIRPLLSRTKRAENIYDSPFIRFYCALYKKLLDRGVATPSLLSINLCRLSLYQVLLRAVLEAAGPGVATPSPPFSV